MDVAASAASASARSDAAVAGYSGLASNRAARAR